MTFESPSAKKHYVNDMFGRIAHRYDLVNRLMAGGLDIYWRRELIREANLPSGGYLLDIATGTGDVAFAAAGKQPELKLAVAADFTLPMLHYGQRRTRQNHRPGSDTIRWAAADTMAIPFPDNTFDVVTSAFLMRNVIDVEATVKEQRRVTKPGGQVLTMDVPRPPKTPFGHLFRFYFHHIMPLFCGLISGEPDAYTYLPHSADSFLYPDQYAAVMESVGLKDVHYRTLMQGAVALHVAVK